MINAEVDPKALHFRQDTFATTINLSKSYLVEESFDDLERIEGMFPPNISVYNPAEESSITAHEQATTTDKSTKIKFLLESQFAQWLNAAPGDDIIKLCKSMMDSSTALVRGGMTILFF